MCYACNNGQRELGCGVDCKSCSTSFFLDLDKRDFTLALETKNIMYPHIPFLDNYAANQYSTVTEFVSKTGIPTRSTSVRRSRSSLSSASDSGDSMSEMNSHIRSNVDEAVDLQSEQPRIFTKHGEVTKSSSFSEIFSPRTSDITNGLDRTMVGLLKGESYENGKDERLPHGEDPVKVDDADATSSLSVMSLLKTNPNIWMPPEPTNFEDDMDSVANNDDDDDDDYNNGTKWGQSTSLGDFDKFHGNNYKEARERAMVEAMNGQFKILVSRFLASEGLTSTNEAHDLGWLDIVTSLSWEAAVFIKPDAKEGRAMDPGSYVKVKCVASGERNQSEVIKGLIFKKNAPHKHMPTKFRNPRLLLVKGVLGQRELGLSSFNSMNQEKDYLKSINEMIEACHPNLVLVEKSVSRDIQELLLAKGMTLVFDMKIARLERIARCIGSQIIPSADILTTRNIKQCDSFHIEKVTEEHISSTEVGRKTSKTLMFLEGFSKPLGCTILLKGAPIDELKRVKRVIQYTIFAAYHLILETSFFADQRVLFSNIESLESNDSSAIKGLQEITSGATPNSCSSSDIPTSNGELENSTDEGFYTTHLDASISSDDPGFVHENDFCEDNFTQEDIPKGSNNVNTMSSPYSLPSSDLSRMLMSSFSASLRKLLQENGLRPITSEYISSFFGFKEEDHNHLSSSDLLISSSTSTSDDGINTNGNITEEKLHDDSLDNGNSEALSTSNEHVHSSIAVNANKSETEGKDDSDGVLSPESILVLLSSQCIEKGIVCEQSHLSRIKYYGNFDVSLGRYLQDVLLNQKHTCSSCGEPPDAHIYCYTHQNGNLTVLVRQLPASSSLSGELEGKIWMWSRCLKCEHENGIPRSTKRVVMSTAARSLSFGKFLELSFTSHSAASRLSSECGHSLHRDCLRFFGLGSRVAMFRYSPVEIYAACKPPPVLEFANPNEQDWVVQEAKSVLHRGDALFSEVENFLHMLKMSCSDTLSERNCNFPGFVRNICEAENMLMQEKSEFEASLLKFVNPTERLEKPVNEVPGLSWFGQELLLALYIWDHRLHQLTQISKDFDRSCNESEKSIEESSIENTVSEFEAASNSDEISKNYGFNEICRSASLTASSSFDISSTTENGVLTAAVDFVNEVNSVECSGHNDASDMLIETLENRGGVAVDSVLKRQHSSARIFKNFPTPNFEDPESLIWVPFAELRNAYKKDLNGGYLQKFLFVRNYTPKYLSPTHQLFPEERGLLHYPVGSSGNIMTVREDEISSIIACALALSEDHNCLIETVDVKDVLVGKMEADKEIDDPYILTSEGSMATSHSSSNGTSDSSGMPPSRSLPSLLPDELSNLVLESALSLDRLLTPENLHPQIPLGSKEGLKKYSVVCIHGKQFHALRRMCCPSEQVYISSLSRCKKWDAQGGKSKAFFAKSMDDRFIIKQIKKAELDSFLKFAPDYFKHITHSLSTGSQTCLAKILGIYQVRITRNGKEVKIDLMVMENLLFGRNVTRTYDLKGALFSRYVTDGNDPEKVLLDQNFVEDMRISPIYVGGRTKHLLQRAVWNDTAFLNAINVMDYSLLVGVDKKQQHMVFGIIDYLRQYTWDKQLETWVKSSLVVPKNSLPTIISPKEYKKRFRKFMSRYFLTVPDSWCSSECSEPCKFCTGGSSNLSSSHSSDARH